MDVDEDSEVMKLASKIYDELVAKGIDVILDDRDIRAGNKFAENEILGIPFSIIIGPRNFANNKYEFVSRKANEKNEFNIDEIKQILEEER